MIVWTPVVTGAGVFLVPVLIQDRRSDVAPPEPPPEPLSGREVFVKAAMVVPTVAEGYANVRLEMAQTASYDPDRGHTLADRQAIADSELRGCLAKLMEQAEIVRAGHLVTTARRR